MKKFDGFVFGIDFDGTCVMHDFPQIGADCPGAVDTLKWIIANGGKLVLNTMRCNDEIRAYLTESINWFYNNDIPLYGKNENPEQKSWTTSPKVYANIYVDDSALGCPLSFDEKLSNRSFVNWSAVKAILEYYGEPMVKIHGKEIVTE